MAYKPAPTHHLRFIARGEPITETINFDGATVTRQKRILQQWWSYFEPEDDLPSVGEWRDVSLVPVEKEDEAPSNG